MDGIVPYLLIFVALVVVASIVLAYWRTRNWRRFAAKYRFRFKQEPWLRKPRVFGEIQGRSFRLQKAETSSDTGVLGLELVQMTMGLFGRLPKDLEISKSAPSLTDEMPSHSILTGDQAFDEQVFVKATNTAEVLKYLVSERRRAVVDLLNWESADWAGVRNNRVVLMERRMVSSLPHLEKRFHFLLDIARRLDA